MMLFFYSWNEVLRGCRIFLRRKNILKHHPAKLNKHFGHLQASRMFRMFFPCMRIYIISLFIIHFFLSCVFIYKIILIILIKSIILKSLNKKTRMMFKDVFSSKKHPAPEVNPCTC